MSRNALLEAGAKSEGEVTATGLELTPSLAWTTGLELSLTRTQATIECGFTLTRVCDMTRTYSQMHRTDKYSEHSSIIWPVWPNG